MKTLNYFPFKTVSYIQHPEMSGKIKATRNVYKTNKIKMKNYCKITADILKTWQSCYIWWNLEDYLRCFTNIHKVSELEVLLKWCYRWLWWYIDSDFKGNTQLS